MSASIRKSEIRYPGIVPNLSQGSTLLLLSDYGGYHKTARYESLAYLVTNPERLGQWNQRRTIIRDAYLPDGRRISFKKLGDKKRKKLLAPYLEIANSIPGLLIVFIIDRSIESLFEDKGEMDRAGAVLDEIAFWKKGVFERLMRIVHFASLLLAGLSGSGQDVLWMSDEDAIVADEKRLRGFVRLFGIVSSHYLQHDLGHLRIGTTKSDPGDRWLEDLTALPDLAAGALSETLTRYSMENNVPHSDLITPPTESISRKAKDVMNWFSNNTRNLRRLVLLIEKDKNAPRLGLKTLRFHGLVDYF